MAKVPTPRLGREYRAQGSVTPTRRHQQTRQCRHGVAVRQVVYPECGRREVLPGYCAGTTTHLRYTGPASSCRSKET